MIKTPKKQRQKLDKKTRKKAAKRIKTGNRMEGPACQKNKKKIQKRKNKDKEKNRKKQYKKTQKKPQQKTKNRRKHERHIYNGLYLCTVVGKTFYAYRTPKLFQQLLVFRKMFQKAVTDLNEQYFIFRTFIYVENFHKSVNSSAPSPKIFEKPLLINNKSMLFTILSTERLCKTKPLMLRKTKNQLYCSFQACSPAYFTTVKLFQKIWVLFLTKFNWSH